MKTAVIKTGGKQYLVSEGKKLKVEKLAGTEKETITFKDVLLAATEKNVKVGTPHVAGAQVEATILQHGKAKKVTGVKKKPKKRYQKYFGHRQPFTELEIKKIKVGK